MLFIFSFFAIVNGLIGLIRNIVKISKFRKNKDKYFNKVEKRKELYNKAKIFYDESRIKKTSAIDGKYIEEQKDIEQN